MEELKFAYDDISDVLTIEGVNYSGCTFRQLGGMMPVGSRFEIISVDDSICLANIETPQDRAGTPEQRTWAIEQAIKSGATNDGWNTVERVAQRYIDYVLKGEA